jgi:hypothetical protein
MQRAAMRRLMCDTCSPGDARQWSVSASLRSTVDAIDSNEIVLGGAEPNGLTSAQMRRIVADINQAVDVVGFTIAEFIPRQVMHLRQIPQGLPTHRQRPRRQLRSFTNERPEAPQTPLPPHSLAR